MASMSFISIAALPCISLCDQCQWHILGKMLGWYFPVKRAQRLKRARLSLVWASFENTCRLCTSWNLYLYPLFSLFTDVTPIANLHIYMKLVFLEVLLFPFFFTSFISSAHPAKAKAAFTLNVTTLDYWESICGADVELWSVDLSVWFPLCPPVSESVFGWDTDVHIAPGGYRLQSVFGGRGDISE